MDTLHRLPRLQQHRRASSHCGAATTPPARPCGSGITRRLS